MLNNRLLSINVEGVTYYPLYNGHGDIVQLTNAAGDVVAWYQYDAWGNMTSHSDDTDWAKNPYRYSGYRYDDATGLYYLNARYYDPSVGRFLSPDAVYETPEYSYALDNPIHLSDPSGLRPMCQCEENINAILRPIAELGAAIAAESKFGPAMVAGNAIQIGMDRADAKRAERSCNCFTAGTKVLTVAGEKNIEDIKVGDKVLAKDEYNPDGELAYNEQLAMKEVLSDPLKGATELTKVRMTDKRWLAQDGWVKMSKNVNGTEIHFVHNKTTGQFDDFKYK
ncbi:hypothetical protein OS242_11010 [Tumebacillus sp. DT12]|uniref:Teneurin-like YD-shell domain-containing protein n=1 Tax=Tumebacillus lacus TaxID=2995335 RepID=A0ABT3X219_9BACL|nr:RHS repeat-associated core domain-containing protein [Tumebacillus lacus]MCX7570491.1 hypothetical protein [Tumebacillus lacus]